MNRDSKPQTATTRPARSHRAGAFTVALALMATLTLASSPTAVAEHFDKHRAERLADLAHELEQAAHDAYYLTHEYVHGPLARHLMRDFRALERAADRFYERAIDARSPYQAERELHRLADRYYEARHTFRSFHGSHHVRRGFHRINDPMERLYRFYTGRDLYRDDPYVKRAHRVERPRDRDRDRTRRLDRRGDDRRFERRDDNRRLDRRGRVDRDGRDGRDRRGRRGRGPR